MDIKIKFRGESFVIKLNDSNTVEELAEKIVENEVAKKYDLCIHCINSIQLIFFFEVLKRDKKLSDYDIKEGDCIEVRKIIVGGGYIDNLKEESKSEKAKKIGFDMNLIKRDELKINLIHFDANMKMEKITDILIILKLM